MPNSSTPKTTNDGTLSGSFHEAINQSNILNTSVLTTQERQHLKDTIKKTSLDRRNDNVYSATTKVVKAIMTLSQGVEKATAVKYLDLVRHVGIELRSLLSSVDSLASIFPSHALKYDFHILVKNIFIFI